MGFDITFHPISDDEIQRFVFEPLNNPSLIESRIKEFALDDENKALLETCYNNFLNKIENQNNIQNNELTYFCAQLSTFLHPYWYVRGIFLSDLIERGLINNLFASLLSYPDDQTQEIDCSQFLIVENYSASGFASSDIAGNIYKTVMAELKQVREQLQQNKNDFISANTNIFKSMLKNVGFSTNEPVFPDDDVLENLIYLTNEQDPNNDFIWALKELEAYCQANKLGFIEAAEIVIPFFDECNGNFDNLRARFLETAESM